MVHVVRPRWTVRYLALSRAPAAWLTRGPGPDVATLTLISAPAESSCDEQRRPRRCRRVVRVSPRRACPPTGPRPRPPCRRTTPRCSARTTARGAMADSARGPPRRGRRRRAGGFSRAPPSRLSCGRSRSPVGCSVSVGASRDGATQSRSCSGAGEPASPPPTPDPRRSRCTAGRAGAPSS